MLHISGMISHLATYFRYLLVGLLLLPAGCTSYISHDTLPYPLVNDTSDTEIKVVTIPLPVIASSPNEGITVGALSAFLLHDKNDNINALLAPQVNYNKNFGVSSSLYAAFYPSPDRFWELNLSKSTIINEDY